MTVLVTGSTSAQANPKAHRNAANFTGLMVRALANEDHNVRWSDPSMNWTAEELVNEYEHVVVGLAPVTSLSANRVYGALSVIGHMINTAPNKLTIVLDAPEPQRIAASFRAVIEHPENLCKPFYSYRKEFSTAHDSQLRLMNVIRRLHHDVWPRVAVPSLPWHRGNHITSQLPYPVKKLVCMNLDAALIDSYRPKHVSGKRHARWLSQGDDKRSLRYPTKKISHRGAEGWDDSVLREMGSSLGMLLAKERFGTWWNTRYAQALATETPVCSDWYETKEIGSFWSVLPSQVEDVTPETRLMMARGQLKQYVASLEQFNTPHNQIAALLNRRVYR